MLSRRQFGSSLLAAAALGGRHARHSASPQIVERASGITDVPGVRVGHFTDPRRPTGCTVLLFDSAVTAGMVHSGGTPGENQLLLDPTGPLDTLHAIVFTGAGPLGIGAADGVRRYLEEQKIGLDWAPRVRVPIVAGAVIDDLLLGDARIRPDADAGYHACRTATAGGVDEGSVGAGAGATVGKLLRARGLGGMKGGVGTASLRAGDILLGALAVVNAAGDIVDWRTGQLLAGARTKDGKALANTVEAIRNILSGSTAAPPRDRELLLRATTLVVVATNVALSKVQATRLAEMADAGAARAIRPYHTQSDGDQLFAVSTGRATLDVSLTFVGALAADLVADAIVRAVKAARSIDGWPASRDVAE